MKISIKFLKYFFITLALIILLILWPIVFVLQSGIGMSGNLFLLPFKLLPVFSISFLLSGALLKIFVKKHHFNSTLTNKRKLLAAGCFGIFTVLFSIVFQLILVSPWQPELSFKNSRFSHLENFRPVTYFSNRTIISTAAVFKLLPLKRVKVIVSYSLEEVNDALLIYNFREQFLGDKNKATTTCKQYITTPIASGNTDPDFVQCLLDFQKYFADNVKFSTLGHTLLTTIFLSNIAYISPKETSNIFENYLHNSLNFVRYLSASVQLLVSSYNAKIKEVETQLSFSSGYKQNINDFHNAFYIQQVATVDGYLILLKLVQSSQKSGTDVLVAINKKTANDKKLISKYQQGLNALNDNVSLLANVNVNEIKAALEKLRDTYTTKSDEAFKKYKTESFCFKTTAFFFPKLNQLSIKEYLDKISPIK